MIFPVTAKYMQPLLWYYAYITGNINKQLHNRLLLYSKITYQRLLLAVSSFSYRTICSIFIDRLTKVVKIVNHIG